MNKIPVSILSYNRPHYLRLVLDSILSQKDIDLNQYNFMLFQDWPESGSESGEFEKVAECINIFTSKFPSSIVYDSEVNLGTALNFDRAEKISFISQQSDVAYFFEDDMVFSPYYFSIMRKLTELALSRDDIGYFSAYGRHFSSLSEQKSMSGKLIPLNQNWGFGLTKYMWLRMRPFVTEYLDLIGATPYKRRDINRIHELMKRWGAGCPDTSQDAVKSVACVLAGGLKINTYQCFAKYIGVDGMNFDENLFIRSGYDKTQVYDIFESSAFCFDLSNLDMIRLELLCYAFRDTSSTREGYVADPRDIVSLYNVLFNRAPESSTPIDYLAGKRSHAIIEELFFSPEFLLSHSNVLDRLESLRAILNFSSNHH